MKKPVILLIAVTIITAISYFAIIQKTSHNEIVSEESYVENEEEEEEESGADKQMSMWFQGRAYPDPYFLDAKYKRAWDQMKNLRPKWQNRMGSFSNWAVLGQSYNGATIIGGRIKCIAIDPNNTNKRIKALKEANRSAQLSDKVKTHQESDEANASIEDRESGEIADPVARLKELLKKIAENQEKK